MGKRESQLFLPHSPWKERQEDAKGFRQCGQQGEPKVGFGKIFLNKKYDKHVEKEGKGRKEGTQAGREGEKEGKRQSASFETKITFQKPGNANTPLRDN